MRRRGALIATLLALTAPAASAAAAGWHTMPSPLPGPQGTLNAVTCPARAVCFAVGSWTRHDGQTFLLAERFDGRRWRLLRTPQPRGAAGARFLDVACTAPSACTFVGSYDDRGGTTHPVAARWDGRRLTLQAVPNGGGDNDRALYAVDCTGPRDCTAAGYDLDTGVVAAHWDGHTWATRVIVPPGTDDPTPSAIDCVNSGDCVITGELQGDGGNCFAPFVLRGHGLTWTLASAAPCRETDLLNLAAVACPAANACFATGWLPHRDTDGRPQPFSERWDGTTWNVVATPDVSRTLDPWGGGGGLDGIACTSATACTAVGTFDSDLGYQPLVERWDGHRWRVEPIGRRRPSGFLVDVAYATRTVRIAVGFEGTLGDGDSEGFRTPLIELSSTTK